METISKWNKGMWNCLATGSLLLAAVLLAACSKDSLETSCDGDNTVPVSFEIEGLSDLLPDTKAALTTDQTVRVIAYKGDHGTWHDLSAYVSEQAYSWNGSKLVPCIVDVNGNKIADAANQVMKLSVGRDYLFTAISPALPLDETKWRVTVGNGVDYATTSLDETRLEIPAEMTTTPYALTLSQLQRQCAKVKFIVKIDDSYQLSQTISFNSMTVTGLGDPRSTDVTGAVGFATSRTQELHLASEDFTNTAGSYIAEYYLLPMNNVDLTFTFDVTEDGTQRTITGNLKSLSLLKSESCTITATLTPESDASFSVVSTWDTNAGNNPGFQHTSYPYVTERTIVTMGKWNCAPNVSFHDPWTTTPSHKEESDPLTNTSGLNTVSKRFRVATSLADDNARPKEGIEACNSYSETEYSSGWRVPTAQELAFVVRYSSSLLQSNWWKQRGLLTATRQHINIDSFWTLVDVSWGNNKWEDRQSTGDNVNVSVLCVHDE